MVIDPRSAANHVLDELGIREPKDLELLDLIAWERGALVREERLDGAEARITMGRDRAVITVSTVIDDPRRRRFNIAHEIGHLELHRTHSRLSICLSDDLDDWRPREGVKNQEQAANEFAAALLLPERFFAPRCGEENPSLNHISQLAEDFNVSLTATAIRYTDFCDEPTAVVFSRDGYIRWFRGSKEFDLLREDLGIFIDVRSRVDPSTRAASFFQGHPISPNPGRIEASAWFVPGNYSPIARIVEQSWGMPAYNAVLSLLWVDEELDEEADFLW